MSSPKDGAAPRPGAPARGSRSGRPIMVLFDVLGRRWTLRILWELREGAQTFRALRERCDGVSPTVLNDRLKELRGLDLVALGETGYALTETGEDLSSRLVELELWARGWAARLGPNEAAGGERDAERGE